MSEDLRQRVEALVGEWNVTVQDTSETESSFLVFGTCRDQPVVLKVVKRPGDEWHSGEVLQAFGGNGVVRVYEYVEGAVLLERAIPAESLVSMAIDGRDGEANTILADVIQRMSGCTPPRRCPTVHDWAKGFDRYLASDDDQIPTMVHSASWQKLSSSHLRVLTHRDDLASSELVGTSFVSKRRSPSALLCR
jgi:streptomycin 6-kinase